MPKRVLVLGCYEHTLTIVRSLSRAGHHTTLGVTSEQLECGYVHASRFVSTTWEHPDMAEDPSGFDIALLQYLEQNSDIETVFPVGEDEIRRIARLRTHIADGVLLMMPQNDAVETCLNKSLANRMAATCKIPTPETQTVRTAYELCVAIRKLGLPAIVKPLDSTNVLLNKKCVFVRTEHDLRKLSNSWPGTEHAYVVQNEISGIRHNCDVVAENGEIKLYFEAEILRTDQLDYAGNSVLDRSIEPDPLHRAYCEQLVKALNYTGQALFQFLRDPETEVSHFLEVNPRAGAAISLAARCGVDLTSAAVGACSGKLTDYNRHYPIGRLRFCMHNDLQGLRKARVYREVDSRQTVAWLGRTCRDALRANFSSTFVWSDPLPTLKIYWNLLIRLFLKEKRGLVANNKKRITTNLDANYRSWGNTTNTVN